MSMTPERLAEIRARAEAATPGPWVMQRFTRVWSETQEDWVVAPYDGTQTWDAEFIAHARQDIPDLLDALEAARETIAAQQVWMRLIGNADWHRQMAESMEEFESGQTGKTLEGSL